MKILIEKELDKESILNFIDAIVEDDNLFYEFIAYMKRKMHYRSDVKARYIRLLHLTNYKGNLKDEVKEGKF